MDISELNVVADQIEKASKGVASVLDELSKVEESREAGQKQHAKGTTD